MLRFLRGSGLPARRRRKADRGRDLRLESLEPRLAPGLNHISAAGSVLPKTGLSLG